MTVEGLGSVDITKPVWIISARVGAGHVQAARAVDEALSAQRWGDRTCHLDLMTLAPAWFRRVYAGGYAWMASRHPKLFGRAFHATDHSEAAWPNLAERLRVRVEGCIIGRLRAQLRAAKPRIIVHTHFLAPAPVGQWIVREGWSTRQLVVVTDFYPHRIWLARPVEHYFVAADTTRSRLVDRGVEPERVSVTGIPIMARHNQKSDIASVYRNFNWAHGRPAILLLAGSDFVVGPIERVVDELLIALPEVTLQVATGRNEALRRTIEAKRSRYPNLRVVGFSERMQDLFSAATLVLTKTGGITTSECLAHGAAVVGIFPVPGQEEANADYLVANGAGVKIGRVADVAPTVQQLLSRPEEIDRMRARAASLGRVDAAQRIADRIIALAS